MSYIKRWFEDNCWQFTTKELRAMGFEDEEIDMFRESYPKSEEGT